jgi:hypothetical protein
LTGDGKDMSPEERRKAAQAGLRVGPSFDDLVDESRFHVRIERPSLRSVGEVPYFASSLESSTSYPNALQEWVESGRQHGHATEPTSTATVATTVAVATE